MDTDASAPADRRRSSHLHVHGERLAAALLFDARHRSGLTQAQLAERSGVVRPLISQYETGKKDPSVTMLAKLIAGCGMELRMRADNFSDSDINQNGRDVAVGVEQAKRNADRARREVVSIRRLTSEEIDQLRTGSSATS